MSRRLPQAAFSWIPMGGLPGNTFPSSSLVVRVARSRASRLGGQAGLSSAAGLFRRRKGWPVLPVAELSRARGTHWHDRLARSDSGRRSATVVTPLSELEARFDRSAGHDCSAASRPASLSQGPLSLSLFYPGKLDAKR